MKFEIHPLKGANTVEFGMTPNQIRQQVGPNFRLFKRGANVEDDDGTHPSDYYAEEGAFFYYSVDGHLEAIEFTPSAAPVIAGVNFFEMPIKEAAEVLKRMDPDMKIRSDTAWSDRLGLALWTSQTVWDEEKQAWEEADEDEDDEDWEAPKVGSVLIAPAGGLDYLNA